MKPGPSPQNQVGTVMFTGASACIPSALTWVYLKALQTWGFCWGSCFKWEEEHFLLERRLLFPYPLLLVGRYAIIHLENIKPSKSKEADKKGKVKPLDLQCCLTFTACLCLCLQLVHHMQDLCENSLTKETRGGFHQQVTRKCKMLPVFRPERCCLSHASLESGLCWECVNVEFYVSFLRLVSGISSANSTRSIRPD